MKVKWPRVQFQKKVNTKNKNNKWYQYFELIGITEIDLPETNTDVSNSFTDVQQIGPSEETNYQFKSGNNELDNTRVNEGRTIPTTTIPTTTQKLF